MAQAGDKEDAIKVANRALAAAESIQDEWRKEHALSGLAHAMAQAGQYTKAVQVLKDAFWISRLSWA